MECRSRLRRGISLEVIFEEEDHYSPNSPHCRSIDTIHVYSDQPQSRCATPDDIWENTQDPFYKGNAIFSRSRILRLAQLYSTTNTTRNKYNNSSSKLQTIQGTSQLAYSKSMTSLDTIYDDIKWSEITAITANRWLYNDNIKIIDKQSKADSEEKNSKKKENVVSTASAKMSSLLWPPNTNQQRVSAEPTNQQRPPTESTNHKHESNKSTNQTPDTWVVPTNIVPRLREQLLLMTNKYETSEHDWHTLSASGHSGLSDVTANPTSKIMIHRAGKKPAAAHLSPQSELNGNNTLPMENEFELDQTTADATKNDILNKLLHTHLRRVKEKHIPGKSVIREGETSAATLSSRETSAQTQESDCPSESKSSDGERKGDPQNRNVSLNYTHDQSILEENMARIRRQGVTFQFIDTQTLNREKWRRQDCNPTRTLVTKLPVANSTANDPWLNNLLKFVYNNNSFKAAATDLGVRSSNQWRNGQSPVPAKSTSETRWKHKTAARNTSLSTNKTCDAGSCEIASVIDHSALASTVEYQMQEGARTDHNWRQGHTYFYDFSKTPNRPPPPLRQMPDPLDT